MGFAKVTVLLRGPKGGERVELLANRTAHGLGGVIG
jgi:hypothetical protein